MLVGGPLHGKGSLMARPEGRMTLELIQGERVVYVRRLIERASNPADPPLAAYAPEGMGDGEFARLLSEAKSLGRQP
jgi:hypothetical protein